MIKGIKLSVAVLAAASLLAGQQAFAQKRGAYETNKAFDNTFIGVGIGMNGCILHPTQPKTWGNTGIAADLNYGKWWTPAVGMRLGWHGLWNNCEQALDTQEAAAGTPFGFHFFHGDILWNLSNSIAGYNPSRIWDAVPYASFGLLDIVNSRRLFAKNAVRNLEYGAGVGVLNLFKVTEEVHMMVDLHAIVGKAHAYASDGGRLIVFPAATVGMVFNLNKKTFERHKEIAPEVIPVPFTTEQYDALGDKLAALEKENAQLKDKAAALENQLAPFRSLVNGQTYLYEKGAFTAVDVKPASPITLYFDCGSAQLSAREKAHLEYFTDNVVNADVKLSVNGYADKQTGSAKRNQQLSEQRAKAVAELLKKAGAKEENIVCAGHGSAVELFSGAAKNRVVTVEVL